MKEFLSRRGVAFTERNVTEDTEALKELVAMGYMGTPVTVTGEGAVVGFDPKRLDRLLAAR